MRGTERVGRWLSFQRRREEESVGRGHRESDGGGEQEGSGICMYVSEELEKRECVWSVKEPVPWNFAATLG